MLLHVSMASTNQFSCRVSIYSNITDISSINATNIFHRDKLLFGWWNMFLSDEHKHDGLEQIGDFRSYSLLQQLFGEEPLCTVHMIGDTQHTIWGTAKWIFHRVTWQPGSRLIAFQHQSSQSTYMSCSSWSQHTNENVINKSTLHRYPLHVYPHFLYVCLHRLTMFVLF